MHEMGGGQGERGALGTAQLSAPREEHPAKLSSVWGGGGGGRELLPIHKATYQVRNLNR